MPQQIYRSSSTNTSTHKGNREDEKEVPPMPLYTMEDTVRRDDHISRYALVKVIKNECLKYSHKQAR
jgi:hypothetical protein